MENTITDTVMKSSLSIKDAYDKRLFLRNNEYLVPISIDEVDEESVTLIYDTEDLTPLSLAKGEDERNIYKLLLGVFPLVESLGEYEYELNPDNLYCDLSDRLKVLRRDIRVKENVSSNEAEIENKECVHKVRSLIAACMQDKYSYENILNGGDDLLSDDESFKELYECCDLTGLKRIVRSRYEEAVLKDNKENTRVKRSLYTALKVFFIAGSIAIIALLAALLVYKLYEEPYLKAMVKGEEDYIKGDYLLMIEDMKNVSIKRMDSDQKYMLARAYIKMENLTDKQKDNIINNLPVNSDDLIKEYWIHIGRKDAKEAENAAMQEADDELLLYAYMLEYENIRIDKRMDGEEKQAKMEELSTKIDELAGPYIDAKDKEEEEVKKEQEEEEKSIVNIRLDELEEELKEQKQELEKSKVKEVRDQVE